MAQLLFTLNIEGTLTEALTIMDTMSVTIQLE